MITGTVEAPLQVRETEQPALYNIMSVDDFWNQGHQITGHKLYRSRTTGHRRFREFFGCSPSICSIVWEKLSATNSIPPTGKPVHLLWTLLFLKRYTTEHVMSSMVGADEKTLRKWIWKFIAALSAHLSTV